MKLLTVVVPCYNSADYMKVAIESLLINDNRIELIIVNDGSSDQTKEIAEEYERKYPEIIKTIHQENGGHGEAVNTGLRHASGLYFKVVDSDDWVDTHAYINLLNTIEEMVTSGQTVDLFINNFVYEKEGARTKRIMKYNNVLPVEKVFSWEEISIFKKGQYFMMHSMVYRTAIIRESGLKLPKKTFYVDNLFVYVPLSFVETMYYMDVDLYRYYIGREDQSVNEQVMISRIDQQIKVNKLLIDAVQLDKIKKEPLRNYLLKHLEIVTVISGILLIKSGTKENLKKKKDLMEYVKVNNAELYYNLRFGLLGRLINLPTKLGRTISIGVYKVSQKIIGFN
ncbi:glycosyltransferase family 2 protein [Marinilactibacillus psychrotolerans]|uniref:glycosyltransferase family 2 protein n=1 Tax=Marinilactibacillus psychrotolerans TaxID=191770 RepID=UPI0039AF4A3E